VLTVWVLDALLADSPVSVYELLQHLRNRAGPDEPVWPSPVYRTLGRLRAWGLVEVVCETGRGGAARKYYDLTRAGREAYPLVRDVAERAWHGSTRTPMIIAQAVHAPPADFTEAPDNGSAVRDAGKITPPTTRVGSEGRRRPTRLSPTATSATA
jgi:DNA-binding PadR family transcriptional regulator